MRVGGGAETGQRRVGDQGERLPVARGGNPGSADEDYLLKQQVVELLRVLDRLGDGVIDALEVKHGLPFRLQYTEPLA